MSKEKLTFDEPHDALTELCNVGLEAVMSQSEPGDRIIVMVMRRGETVTNAGLALNGYEDESQLLTDMLLQTKSVARVYGRDVLIAPLRRG